MNSKKIIIATVVLMISICSLLAETRKPKTREEIIAIAMCNTVRVPGEVYIDFFEGPFEAVKSVKALQENIDTDINDTNLLTGF